MPSFRNALALVIVPLFLLSVGCVGPKVQVADVSGTVTMNGKPLELVAVEFWPVADGGMRSMGKTDKDGKFTLKTDDGLLSGASIGNHKVVLRDTWHMQDDYIDKNSGEMVDMSKGRKGRIPWKYFEVTTSPVSAEVKAGAMNEFSFQIKP